MTIEIDPHVPAGPVEIVDYSLDWPRLFEEERRRILGACGAAVVAIEHVGSTAVPGLAAKPIIDIMPGLARHEDGDLCVDPLRGLGYAFRGELGIPGRRYFSKGTPKSHQIHMLASTNPEWDRHLMFRDYLRRHPETASQYAALKRDLALRFRNDREGYTEGKTDFIRSIEALARAEA